MLNIRDRNILITGGASGIGLELAKLVLSNEGRPIIVDNNESLLEKSKDILQSDSIKPLFYHIDLSKIENHAILFQNLKRSNITIDVLINNVAITKHRDFHKAEWEDILKVINVNLLCMLHLCHFFLPSMIKKGSGVILNISSTSGLVACPHMICYSATKAFINKFSETLSMELKNSGVRVKCVCIGATDTAFFENSEMLDMNYVKRIKKMNPTKVASECLKMLSINRLNKIIGLNNKFNMLAVKFMPESIVHKISMERFK